jgi:hypothetical protein
MSGQGNSMSSGGKTFAGCAGILSNVNSSGETGLNDEDKILSAGSEDMAASLLKAADEVELMADVLAVDIETWGAEYAAALRRKAYALTA